MSISVRGTVVISRKNGKRGAFNVGELNTEIGNFEVKDACIEEFDEARSDRGPRALPFTARSSEGSGLRL